MMSHPLLPKLRQLNLSGILNTLDVPRFQPWISNCSLGVPGFTARRRIGTAQPNYQVKKISLSGCDHSKTLAHFDFSAAPGINRILIQDLAGLCLHPAP